MSSKGFDGRISPAIARASMSAIAPKSDAARSVLLQNLPKSSEMLHAAQSGKTKPFAQEGGNSSDSLSPRQLAAARALARGAPNTAVARELHLTRQTIHRWKCMPLFQVELRRLHELLATQSGESSTRASPPRAIKRPPIRSGDAEIDKLMNNFLGRST